MSVIWYLVRLAAVTQQNRVRVKLENIPEITNMMEGGERKWDCFLLLFLKGQRQVCSGNMRADTQSQFYNTVSEDNDYRNSTL